MTQYNTFDLKWSNSPLDLKSGIENGIEVTLKLSSKVILIRRVIFRINCY